MTIDRHFIVLFLKGMAMGAADSVPGVSGGTVALITNIYEELVDAIKSLGWHVLIVWKHEGFLAAWRYMNGRFLLTLGAGILTSLLLFGNLIISLMDTSLPYLLAFFAGLVLASIRYVAMGVARWNVQRWLLLIAGAVFAMVLAFLPLRESGGGLVYYFFCGAIAICAMILPGISGAFILLLLGAYAPVLEALTGFDVPVIVVFAAGCLCGLMLFTRLLSWLLHHHHENTLAVLTGMLTGSLYLLWPWRVAVEVSLEGFEFTRYRHVLPDTYLEATGQAFSAPVCLGLAVAGVVLVLLLETVAGNNNTEKPPASDPSP
jgi:putative membrane protein